MSTSAQPAMRELGKTTGSTLERFGRNQRRAALVAPKAGWPKGVQRFRDWREFESWQRNRRTD
ncbi:MAG: hypothetical protein JNG82_08170 [Opitutaceae bacterium]|jgi:hypothetical protein|nr:hypothetical protein [Opitutaceae bacterium]